jgi:hypothetical protein
VVVKDTGTDAPPACPACGASTCCAPNICRVAAPNCGACSAAGGACGANSDCCNGLVCNAQGKCAAACKSSGGCGGNGDCCLGTTCKCLVVLCSCGQ